MRKAVWALLASVTVAGVLLLFVFPARTLLAQRTALLSTSRRIEVLARENATLSKKIARLKTPSEIAKIARQRYGLVRPGEKAYAILPPGRVRAKAGGAGSLNRSSPSTSASASTPSSTSTSASSSTSSSASESSRASASTGTANGAKVPPRRSGASRPARSSFWRRLEFWR